MNSKNRRVVWFLSALLALSVAFACTQAVRVQALENQVNAEYQRAFYETVELVQSMEGNMEKLMVTASGAQEQKLLGEICRQAQGLQVNLASLPADLAVVSGTLKFANQLGDFCRTLGDRLSAGGAIGEADGETLATLHATCAELRGQLSDLAEGLHSGTQVLSTRVNVVSLNDTQPAESLVSFPTLLYDGPFSDGREDGNLIALGTQPCDSAAALERARSFIGEERVHGLWITGEGSVPVPCYEISAYVDEGLISMAVTKQGGAVVYMMIDGVAAEAFYSQASLIDLAAAFLKSRGYPDVQVSYWVNYDNYLTVNFAVTEDGIVLYPDLIKVELSMESGLVVGFEAVNYLTNHTRRVLPDPALSEEEARALLNPVLSVTRSRLCVIPLDSGEALAYEFSVMMGEARYLVYLDALTGDELTIYRVVEDENGQLAI